MQSEDIAAKSEETDTATAAPPARRPRPALLWWMLFGPVGVGSSDWAGPRQWKGQSVIHRPGRTQAEKMDQRGAVTREK